MTLKRLDQVFLWLAILGLVMVCWGYLLNTADSMSAMTMGNQPWNSTDFLNMFLMWTIMMIAMMVPTAVRTLMIFSRLVRRKPGDIASPTICFLAGYILIWTGFSGAATALQWLLDRTALLSPMLEINSAPVGAALLVIAGIYQLTPLKQQCLQHCRSPANFISENFKPGRPGAIHMGLQHGLYCLGCCWALMLILFVAGVMSLLWILLITAFVLLEKLLPAGATPLAALTPYISGAGLILAGAAFLLA